MNDDDVDWEDLARTWMKRATVFQALLLQRGEILGGDDADRIWGAMGRALRSAGPSVNAVPEMTSTEPEVQHLSPCHYPLALCSCPREHILNEAQRLELLLGEDERLRRTVRRFIGVSRRLDAGDAENEDLVSLEQALTQELAELVDQPED